VLGDRSIYQPSPWAHKFHTATADEVLGGGSAGPGKSLTLLWDPLVSQAVIEHARMIGEAPLGYPEWVIHAVKNHPIRAGESEGHALHLRRSMPQLKENIQRSMRMFPKFDPDAVYSKEDHCWTFSSGYKYTFGHCREENSHEDYLSKQYTHLGFDEAFSFTERQYEELDARVRSADPVLRPLLRTRLMSNPAPGWLKDHFVSPEPSGNVILKRKIVDPETGETRWKTRLFLPAKLDDNPDKGFVSDYKFKLLSKPSHMRARYLYGDWDSMEGGYFENDYNPTVHVIEPFKIPRDWPKFRSLDWGYRAQGVVGWFALDPDENLYLFYEFNFRMLSASQAADRVIEIEKEFGFWDKRRGKSRLTGVADTQLWEERGDSGIGKAAEFSEKGVYWQPADKASIFRNAERVTSRLRDYDTKKPPGLMIFKNCRRTQEMLASIGIDETDSTIPDKKSKLKHWFDVLAYASARASRGRESIVMDIHEYDQRDREEDGPSEDTGSGGQSYGYGS
jgi:hypothetical protein